MLAKRWAKGAWLIDVVRRLENQSAEGEARPPVRTRPKAAAATVTGAFPFLMRPAGFWPPDVGKWPRCFGVDKQAGRITRRLCGGRI